MSPQRLARPGFQQHRRTTVSAQCPYDRIDTVPGEVGSGRVCPTCKRRICTRCGKPAGESWMSGTCSECYSITSRLLKQQERIDTAYYTERRVIDWFAEQIGGVWPSVIEEARAKFEPEKVEWPEVEMWTPPEVGTRLNTDDYDWGLVPASTTGSTE